VRDVGTAEELAQDALFAALEQWPKSDELSRAVGVAMAYGPGTGLEVVDRLALEPSLKQYYLLPSVRGHLLRKLGRDEEAGKEFERAASLTRNARERQLLLARAAARASTPAARRDQTG
jgi:predicted RNA polymerase sigma factor